MAAPAFPAGFDFTDPGLWENRMPVEEFATLRRTAPVWWCAQPDATSGGFRDGGYWVVSKYEDVKEISRSPEIYSSAQKGAIIQLPDDVTPEQIELTGAMLINMDAPKHAKIRRIVSKPDEIVRWATPVNAFQRTAALDTELGGQQIKQGQRLGIFYSSANFDEDAFENPFTFDVLRDPNPHVGFGGTGAHYCVGANLARLEIALMFTAIADAMPEISQIADPVRLRSGWINGIKNWQVRYE